MSVIVRGMEMPKGCGLCRFDDYGYCTMAKRYSGGSETHGIASFCPLVELPKKHGRLIDADAFFSRLSGDDFEFSFHVDGVFVDVSKMNRIY